MGVQTPEHCDEGEEGVNFSFKPRDIIYGRPLKRDTIINNAI